MPEGMDLSASFTYTVDDGGSITTHKFDMDVSGQNDAPELSLDESGDPQTISLIDADAGATITKATITLKNGEAGDELSVNLDGTTGLSAKYVNGVLTITGSATADVYQSVLQSLSHSTNGEFTIGGDRTLDIVVTDDQGADSNSATASVTVDTKDWSFNEDDLVDDAGNQIIGHWKPAGSSDSASMTKVVMNFGGKDYTRVTPINEAGDFKITIEDTDGTPPIPVMGIIYFRANGTIELVPTKAIDFMPEGLDLSASFTYTVEDGGNSTNHTFGMKVSGQNDAPEIEFIASDSHDNASGLFGNIEITDPDMGDKINSATVTLKDGSLKDAINIDVEAIFKDFGITVTNTSAHELTFSGEASKEDYEAALSRVYFLSENLASNRQLTLDIAVTDKAGATGKAETTIDLNTPTSQEFLEDDLLEDAESNEGSVLTERWKPEGAESKITSVVMTYNGKDYVRDIGDFTNGNYFKITIEDQEGAGGLRFDPIGEVFFHADGRVEFRPTENLNILPEGHALAARFTYTTEFNGVSEVHGMDIKLIGDKDSPHITFEPSSDHGDASGLFGKINVGIPDAGTHINYAKVSIENALEGEELRVDVEGIEDTYGDSIKVTMENGSVFFRGSSDHYSRKAL